MIQTEARSVEMCADKSPLLRSIAVELRERTRDIRDLETKQTALRAVAGSHAKEIADITARLSVHRRELRLAQNELERLGWFVEELVPLRLFHLDTDGAEEVTWPLGDTGFYRAGNG